MNRLRVSAFALLALLGACGEPDVPGPPSAAALGGAAGAPQPGVSGWTQIGGGSNGGTGAAVRQLPMGGGGGGSGAGAASSGGSGGAIGEAGAPAASGGAAAIVPGSLLINELVPNEPGSDSSARLGFVELSGLPGLVLDGAVLELVNGSDGAVYDSVQLSGSVGESGYFVVGEADVVPRDQSDGFNIQNGPDSVRLVDAAGTLLDAAGYGDFGAGAFFAGETAACPLAGDGLSLGRRAGAPDSDDNARDFCEMNPTPGADNGPCTDSGSGGAGGTTGSGGAGAAGMGGSETGGAGGSETGGAGGSETGGGAGVAGAGCACAALL